MSVFAVTFIGKSPMIPGAGFSQVDATHWVLDVVSAVTPDYRDLKEIALFLTQTALPPDAALGLYVSVGTFRNAAAAAAPATNPPTHTSPSPLQVPESGRFVGLSAIATPAR